ncbi:MAG: RidA family protein [Deltaproteobacteria bacterium]|jgi:enamine deaminase RidA (YjgF/YER057c/UK114 family)
MSRHEIINPESLGAPRGYSNGILAAPGRLLFVAGQIAWDGEQKLVSDDFATQFGQALANVVAVVKAAGGTVEDLCRLTVYVTDKQAYIAGIKQIGARYRELMGRHYPTMALVEVADLLEEGAQVEIEGTAVVPTEAT